MQEKKAGKEISINALEKDGAKQAAKADEKRGTAIGTFVLFAVSSCLQALCRRFARKEHTAVCSGKGRFFTQNKKAFGASLTNAFLRSCYSFTAMASTSTRPPFGSLATSTQERAGLLVPNASA